jgi:hypothetical protein
MVTGIFGAVMGFVGYRRSNQIKALDLRLELRKALGDTHESLSTLRPLMDNATGSRRGILAAKSSARSGAMVAFERMVEVDRAALDNIAPTIRSEDADFAAMSAEQLESEIVAIHKIKTSLSALFEKYRGEMAKDDEDRRQLVQQHTTIAAARMSQNK